MVILCNDMRLVAQSYPLFGQFQGWKSFCPGLLSTGFQNFPNMVRGLLQLFPLLPRRPEKLPYPAEEFILDLVVFQPPPLIALCQVSLFNFTQKQGNNGEEITFVWVLRICHWSGIGDDCRDFFSEAILCRKDFNGVVIRLAHLPAV